MDKIQELYDNHWEYVEKVIRNEFDSETEFVIDGNAYCRRVSFHYKTAFRHGFKHGVQSVTQNKGVRNNG